MFITGQKIVSNLKEKVYVNVYFDKSTTEREILTVLDSIKKKAYTREAYYLSSDEAAKGYKQELDQDFVEILGYNPLPDGIELSVKSKYGDHNTLRIIEKELYKYNGVTEVVTQTNLIDEINKNKELVSGIFAALAVLFIFISFFLINGTIRLSIYSKRFLIRSMQLVGATEMFIVKPFLKKSVIQALIGFLISVFFLFLTIYIVGNWANDLIFSGQMKWIDADNKQEEFITYGILFTSLMLIGVLISLICTYWSTKRYLHSKIEDLY